MTDVKNDPFAAVAAQQAASTPPPPAAAQNPSGWTAAADDPFNSAHDMDDPFATSDEFRGGGDFNPAPPIELLRGRLVAMFARKFEAAADNPHWKRGMDEKLRTREMYTVDLYVLDGGPLVFDRKIKGDPEKGTEDTYETYDAGSPTAAEPYVLRNHWVPQGNLIRSLKGSHRKGAPYLAVLQLGAQAADRRSGETDAKIQAKYDAWIKRNKVGDKPSYSWIGDIPNAAQRAVAREFWAAHRDRIDPINVATAPAAPK